MKFVGVVFDIPIQRIFYYLTEKEIFPFVRVYAPIGNRKKKGFVIEVKEEIEEKIEAKKVIKIYDSQPIITNEIFEIAKFISEKYYCSIGQSIFSIIGGLPFKTKGEKNFSKRQLALSFSKISQKFEKKIFLWNEQYEKLKFYINLISEIKNSGIFLFPEISIAEYYFEKLRKNSNKEIVFFHGDMKRKERFEKYMKILNGEKMIIFGTRIAVFSPISDLEIIVIDSHADSSYKEKQYPGYDTIEIAEERCKYRNIPLILSSYSFSIRDYNEIISKKLVFIDRRNFEKFPEVLIFNKKWNEMDNKLSFLTKFSSSLLEETILKNQKVGIVHNRKGSEKTFKCENCGYIFRCKKCNSILILSENNLICKYCKTIEKFEKRCPKCKSKKVIERVVGIEKMFKILKQVYPELKIKKITAEEKEISEDFNICIGTKIVLKLLDKFNFGLIIFPHSESFLNMPEYNSEEKFFILINEFLAKMKKNDKLIIQTKNLYFEIFRALKEKKIEIFYNKELDVRKKVGYPPFEEIMEIKILGKKTDILNEKISILKDFFEIKNVEIIYSDKFYEKDQEGFKLILKVPECKRPTFEEIMKLKEKFDFKIEINPEIL